MKFGAYTRADNRSPTCDLMYLNGMPYEYPRRYTNPKPKQLEYIT